MSRPMAGTNLPQRAMRESLALREEAGTADRPQERGIHVHVYKDGEYVVDDTFGTVIHNGRRLDRSALFDAMVASTNT